MSTNNTNLADTKNETVDTKVLISTERTVLNNSVTINGDNGVGQGFVVNAPARFCKEVIFKDEVTFLGPLSVDCVVEATPGAGIKLKPKVNLDKIDECTPLAGVTVLKDLKAQTNLCTNSIKELTGGSNINMQNTTCFTAGLITDTVDEKTAANGILIDGLRVKDGSAFVGDNLAQEVEHQGNKDQPFGYAGLNAAGKVPISSLEAQPLVFRGCWDATTNNPPLASGVGTDGDYWLVEVAGTTNLDGYNSWSVGDAAVFKAGAPGSWTRLDNVDEVVSVNGQTGVVSLALNDLSNVTVPGPSTGEGLYWNGSNWVNTPVLRTLDGVAPALPSGNVDLVAGTNITITPGVNSITISSTASGAVSLSDGGVAGGHQSLVASGVGPTLSTKGLVGGTGITLSNTSTDVTITNNSPASSVTLMSGGGAQSLVGGDPGDGNGPALTIKGLDAGTGISFSSTNDAVTIINSSPASSITLGAPVVAGESLVANGTAPNLSVKRLVAGSNITLTPTGNDITIAGAASAGEANTTSSAGGTSLVLPKSGVNLPFKGLTSTGVISLTANANDVQISSSAEANTSSSAGGTSLVLPKVGVNLPFKGLTAGQNITLTANANDVNIQSQWIMGAGPSRIYWDDSKLAWNSYNNHIKFITGDAGSFTIPIGISKVIVTAMGGGGGGGTGGYGQGTHGGGGGSGYIAMGVYNVVTGDTFTHTIGAGGGLNFAAPVSGGNTTVTYTGAGSAVSSVVLGNAIGAGTNSLIAAGGGGGGGAFGFPFNPTGGAGLWAGAGGNNFGSGTSAAGATPFTPSGWSTNFFDVYNGNFYVAAETNEHFQNTYAPFSGTTGNNGTTSTAGSLGGKGGGGVYAPKDSAALLIKAVEFVGSIAGTVLTVTSVNPKYGPIHIGQNITGAGVTAGTYITSGSGLNWTVNNAQAVGPITFSGTYPTSTFNGTYYEIAAGRPRMPILVTSLSAGRICSGQVLVPNPGNQTRGVWVEFVPNNMPLDSATFTTYSTTTAGAPPTQTLLANPTTFTLDVVSTAGFPTAGTVIVSTTLGQPVPVTYTSINATQLMGCQTDTHAPGGPYTVNAGSSVAGPVIIVRVPNNTYKVTSGANAHTGRMDFGPTGGGPGAGLPGISVVVDAKPAAPNSGAGGSGGSWLDGTGVGGYGSVGGAGWVIYELFK